MISLILALVFAILGIPQLFLTGHQFIGLLFVLLAALFLLSKWKKKPALILLMVGLVVFGAFEIPIINGAKGTGDKGLSVIVVLGCAVYGETPSRPLTERVNAAAVYLKENPDTLCICSGGQGHGETISEAECMRRMLVGQGIDSSRIFLEDQSTSTKENIDFSYDIINQLGLNEKSSSVGFVSNEYHLFRIRYLAKRQGHEIETIAAATTLPLIRVNYFIREVPAMLKALVVH